MIMKNIDKKKWERFGNWKDTKVLVFFSTIDTPIMTYFESFDLF